MKSKFVMCTALATAIFYTSCSNNTSTTSSSSGDTASSQSSNAGKDTGTMTGDHSNMSNMNMGGDLMSAMNSSMDKMHSMKMSGDFDMDWANMMVEHHQGAIDMAQVEVSRGKDDKLKAKAQEIITKQKDEQQKLKDMVKDMKPSDMKMGEGELEKSLSAMMDKMKSMKMSGDVDKDFATMMIHHHEEGIAMAKKEVANGMNTDLKKLAQKSISDQQKDISEFKSLSSSLK